MKLPLYASMSNEELAHVFSFVAQVVGLDPKNIYRAKAYEQAGVVIHQCDIELTQKYKELQKKDARSAADEFAKIVDALPGIGEKITAKLVTLCTTGDIPAFQRYVKDLPAGMYALVGLYGIGVKRAYSLAIAFSLDDPKTAVDEVLSHAKNHEIRYLEGFGEKSEQDLVDVLTHTYQKSRIPYADAIHIAQKLKEQLEQCKAVKRVEFLGSLRRKAQYVGDIDIGVICEDLGALKSHLHALSQVKKVLVAGTNMIRIIFTKNYQVDIKLSSSAQWGSFLQHFTGSKEHNIKLRELAQKNGFSLSEYGIKNTDTGKLETFSDEKAFYHFLGFDLIPPEERVGGKEFDVYTRNTR